MRFVIVTGVSGAGKTAALKMLEDANYFCVDNLPIPLLEKFASLMPEIHGEDVQNVALGIDARSGRSLDELEVVLDRMEKAGYQFEILFLDAEDSVLVKRYKETRRSHPLAMGGRVDDGIRLERERMRFLKERADYIIDTSHLLTRELKQEIERIFVENQEFCNMMISVLSFGFKYGIPADADLVFDVRFLPNPYYVDELRPLTGLDERVFNYVMDCDIAREFADKLEDMIEFLIPNYVNKERLIHRVYNNVSNADFLYFFDVWLEIECKPRFASFHEEAVYRKDHHYHQQSQHHHLRHALQSVFKSYRTYQHCRGENYRHKQYHCQRICKHGIKVLGYTGCVQIGKRPACSGKEIPQHPPGYRGVEHQQYIASNHRGNAVVMPF